MPEKLDVWRAVAQQATIEADFNPRNMGRLMSSVRDVVGMVHADLRFGRDTARQPCISGHVSAALELECQRCLKSVVWPVDEDVSLGLVQGHDEARALPDVYDPYLVEDEVIDLPALVEDQLLLALPQVAKHADADCRIETEFGADIPDETDGDAEENPFAVLAQLKHPKDS